MMVWRILLFSMYLLMIVSCGSSPVNLESSQNLVQDQASEISGSIAFIGSDGNIYLVRDLREGPLNVTHDAVPSPAMDEGMVTYREPTWSPAGDRLAYVRRYSPVDGREEFQLEVYEPITGRTRSVFNSHAYYPFYLYWSPDNQLLTFLTTGDGPELNLWITEAEGEARVIDQGQPYYWTWMGEGEQIFLHSGGSVESNPEGARLGFLGPGESSQTELAIAPLDFQAPDLMRSGDQVVVYGRPQGDDDGLYMLSREGEIQALLAEVEGRVAFEISPTGSYLAILTGESFQGNFLGALQVVDIRDPENPKNLPEIKDQVFAFWWSPKEDRLLYVEPYVAPLDPVQPAAYRAQDEANLRLRAHIYEPDRNRSYPLVTFTPSQEYFRVLHFFEQYQRSTSFWSPDGISIIYPSLVNGRDPELYILDVSGETPPVRVGDGILGYWSLR